MATRSRFLAGSLALAACSKVGDTEGSSAPGASLQTHVLRWSDNEDIAGLNPHLVQQTPVATLAQLAMAWLIRWDDRNQPFPELLTEIPSRANAGISADGLEIVYRLRHDAVWSDGVPFSGDDVAFSFRVVLNPANNEISRTGWDRIVAIEQPDRYTVVLRLKEPYSPYIETFFSTAGANPCVLPKHILGDLPNINHAPYNALPVGIGPFTYVSWKRGQSVELAANPRYFRGRPKLDRVIYKIIPDRNSVLTELTSGNLDLWAFVPSSLYPQLTADAGIRSVRVPSAYFAHVDFNLTHPALAERDVRLALVHATDRRTILDKIQHGLGTVQDTPIPPSNPVFDPSLGDVPFDLGEANRLLDAAGWKRGADGVRGKGANRLALDLATITGNQDRDQWAEQMQSTWQQAGVALTVKHYLPSLMFAPYSEGGILYRGKFDTAQYQWGTGALGDLTNLYRCDEVPPNGQNVLRYCNATVDAALRAFIAEYDPAKRKALAFEIQRQIVHDVPSMVLFVLDDVHSYTRNLKNFRPGTLTIFDQMMDVDL